MKIRVWMIGPVVLAAVLLIGLAAVGAAESRPAGTSDLGGLDDSNVLDDAAAAGCPYAQMVQAHSFACGAKGQAATKDGKDDAKAAKAGDCGDNCSCSGCSDKDGSDSSGAPANTDKKGNEA